MSMTTKRMVLGVGGDNPNTYINPMSDRTIIPDIAIYFAYNGFAVHSFKNGESYIAVAATREELLTEIKSLLKRGE